MKCEANNNASANGFNFWDHLRWWEGGHIQGGGDAILWADASAGGRRNGRWCELSIQQNTIIALYGTEVRRPTTQNELNKYRLYGLRDHKV